MIETYQIEFFWLGRIATEPKHRRTLHGGGPAQNVLPCKFRIFYWIVGILSHSRSGYDSASL
jgi:hypothetical protein